MKRAVSPRVCRLPSIAGVGLLALALALACGQAAPPPSALPPGYELPYGPDPFAPSEARLDGASLLPPGALTGSAACGACHPEIYRQWQDSLHRPAATDPFTRFAIDRMAEDYGVASTRLCVSCHEVGTLLAGGIDRAASIDEATRREGVSCLSCHLVSATQASDQAHVIANGGYTVSVLPRDVLFPENDPDALSRHALALRRPFLSENRFCDACHRFFIPSELGGSPPGRLRLQSQEALGTRFGDPAAPGYQSCVDCHMPRIPGTDPAARQGLIHDHRALGANVLVPTLEGNRRHAEATVAFRRAGAVSLELGDLARDPQGGLSLPLSLRNDRNGHDFPTGATDISEAWAELTLTDATGALVYRSPGLDANRYLAIDAPSLSSVVVLPGGALDALHDLLSQVELRHHPRVRPGGSLTLSFAPRLAPDVALPLTARVVLRARHGNERWNRWVFNWQDVEVPVTDLAEASRVLSVVPPPAPPAPVDAAPGPTPPEGMVFVPGGTYTIGADVTRDPEAYVDEWPPHPVTLAPFFLDRVPVTNARYADAVARGVVPPPVPTPEPPYDAHAWNGDQPPVGQEDHPVVLITRSEAAAYCAALGKRLPTEAEWEAAARGHDDRRYAWGDTFDPTLCNTAEAGRGLTVAVGSAPANASPCGALDLGCNVSELCADDYAAYPTVRNLDNRDDWYDHFSSSLIVSRGASYDTSASHARVTNRTYDEPLRKLIGFRCAASVPASLP